MPVASKPTHPHPTVRAHSAHHAHHPREDDAEAFVPDPNGNGKTPLPADDAESFAEEFIQSATAAEPAFEDARDEVVDEEQGGPFIIEQAGEEIDPERLPIPP